MKFKTKEITNENTLLSHMILNCLNSVAFKKVESVEGRNDETEYDIVLTFEGVELDIKKFFTLLDNEWESEMKRAARPEAELIFEEMKHTFISKNSTNAKLESIRKQVVKANEQMQNINNALSNLKGV